MGGMITSFTSDDTTAPNAAPMMMPTARSMALPLMMNVLNSLSRPTGPPGLGFQADGPAAATASLTPAAYFLKLSVNSRASLAAAWSYAAASAQVWRGMSSSLGTSGTLVTVCTPKTG